MTTMMDRARATFRRIARRSPDADLSESVSHIEPDLPEKCLPDLRVLIDSCLARRRSVVVAQARAAQLANTYASLTDVGQERFYQLLIDEYGPDRTSIGDAIGKWGAPDSQDPTRAEHELRIALEPRWKEVLLALAALPSGVKFVVDMREDLRHFRSSDRLAQFDRDMRLVLADWFDIGFVELKELTWANTPAEVLERLIEYEAVHEISSWDDLRNRLGPDRKLFAFFHHRMPMEPLIFVEVALTSGPATNLDVLLDVSAPDSDPTVSDTAVFYSISNCQPGLAGVSFGNTLIKRVVGELQRTHPQIANFETLSPIPGLNEWIRARLTSEDFAALGPLVAELGGSSQLLQLLDDPGSAIARRSELAGPLTRACARYLVNGRDNGKVSDRVARFHLSNGARVERINWAANTRQTGLDRSLGMMVNYRYSLAHIEQNQEALDTGTVAASAAVIQLAGDA